VHVPKYFLPFARNNASIEFAPPVLYPAVEELLGADAVEVTSVVGEALDAGADEIGVLDGGGR
jgi:hypothetical protein